MPQPDIVLIPSPAFGRVVRLVIRIVDLEQVEGRVGPQQVEGRVGPLDQPASRRQQVNAPDTAGADRRGAVGHLVVDVAVAEHRRLAAALLPPPVFEPPVDTPLMLLVMATQLASPTLS